MHRSRWLWRWRHNPLRQRSYLVEAWALLAVTVIALGGAVLTGSAVAVSAEHRAARHYLEAHRTTAVLTQNASDAAGYSDLATARVRWTAADGTTRAGRAGVGSGAKAGSRVIIWTDGVSKIVAAPPSPAKARLEAQFTGAAAACGVCAGMLAAWEIARCRTDRRRARRWADEWEVVGPRWSHRNA
jgi:hypothetical protein